MKLALYLLVYLGVPGLLFLLPKDHPAGAVLAIAYIFLAIPFAILRAIDFYRDNDGTTFFSRAFNLLFRVPLALFGLVCIVAGLSIIGWVLYNILVERQKEYTGPSWILGLGSFGVAVPLVVFGWFTLRSAWRRKEKATLTVQGQEEFDHDEDDEEQEQAARPRLPDSKPPQAGDGQR